MVVATNATERLDAIVVGASVEGLFAAACLASAGKHVAIFDSRPSVSSIQSGDACFVDVEAATSLDLVAHGLRYAAPPPIVGVSQERSLVIWPDVDASSASISGLSSRDADAFPAFAQRLHRLASSGAGGGGYSLLNWHLSAGSRELQGVDAGYFRGSSVSRILEEEFASSVLKGILGQAALHGRCVSPSLPGSAVLLLRHSILALMGRERGCRYVAGGARALVTSLLASLKFFNTADIHFGTGVREVIAERDIVQGVILTDGSTVKAPQVISTLDHAGSHALLGRLSADASRVGISSCLGRISYQVKTPPAVRGLSAAVVTSGATISLNPSLERLARGYGALQARQLVQDYCVDLHVGPNQPSDGVMSWTVLADVLYVPPETDEGPWSGNRRERFVSAVTKAIEVWAPGFELSVESPEMLQPVEVRSFLEEGGSVTGGRGTVAASPGLPPLSAENVERVGRGVWLLGESLSAGTGQAGCGVARALVGSVRGRGAADA